MHDAELIRTASAFHPWDAMAPAALSAILKRAPFRASAETGCGGSTIVFSNASEQHFAFAIEGKDFTLTELRRQHHFRSETVRIVEGDTRRTVPQYKFDRELDMILLDGPHAYPLPQIEFAYLFPWLKIGGWLVLDDLQIPSVYELFRFLRKESEVLLEEVVVRTAFFRRLSVVERGMDGWDLQGINRTSVLRYSWRDRLRRLLK